MCQSTEDKSKDLLREFKATRVNLELLFIYSNTKYD